jgi:ATP-dependent Clp protease ATP-binding subunit ClpC
MGAGGREGTSDIASQLKPVLARGDLACIAATTDDEHRRFIETDAALERRFQPIRVQELTSRQSFAILAALRDKYRRTRNIEIADHVLNWLIDFSQDFLRNRYFPDKAVDLLEQCVAYATAHARKQVDLVSAQTVAQRIVGMPIALNERLGALRQGLRDQGLMGEGDVETLVNRLAVTMRGLDLRASRPNAVVLLLGEAASNSEALAETIADSLFGSAERVVTIDFSRFTQPHDVTMLIGAPPGYVGYSDSLPLHKVAQMPWCVLRCENVHVCHPAVREVLTHALDEGFLTDARGKRIFLSDVVALLTAGVAAQSRRAPGFRKAEADPPSSREAAEDEIGRGLVAQADLVCAEARASEDAERNWLEQRLLAGVQERYYKQGMDIRWDASLLEWLIKQKGASGSQRDWERLVDERLSPLLVEHLPESREGPVRSLIIYWDGSRIRVEEDRAEERSE